MGILEDVLGSVLGGQRRGGGMQGGGMQGGLPGGLGGMLGGGSQGGMSPIMMALMALLTQQMSRRGGVGTGGGLGDLLGGLAGPEGMGQIGGSGQVEQPDRSEPRDQKPIEGGIGNRGEFSGGHTGFDGLLEKLERAGQGQKANSWVSHGQNEPISPHELKNALGDDTVDQLATQTGMPKGDLLSQLSELLPGVVDKLTPSGRRPTLDETQKW